MRVNPFTHQRHKLLTFLASVPSAPARDIAKHLGVLGSAVGSYVIPLRTAGFIIDVKDTPPRYAITSAGRDILSETVPEPPKKPSALSGVALDRAITGARARIVDDAQPGQQDDSQPSVNRHSPLDEAIEALATALVARISKTVEDQVATLIEGQITSAVNRLTAGIRIQSGDSGEAGTAGILIHTGNTDENATGFIQFKAANLPRALVVGLLPMQNRVILSHFSDKYRLQFWKNESTESLRSRAKASDVVFVMARFVSHSTTDILFAADRSKVIMVTGAVSDLRATMDKFSGNWKETHHG